MIEHRVDAPAPAPRRQASALSLWGDALKERPLGAGFGMLVEYLMFFAAVLLALGLFVTRVPLRILDDALGLRLRERFVNFIARVSPG